MKKDINKPEWRKRLRHEFIEYWIYVFYLAFFFGAFSWYQRFILASYNIEYLNFGAAIIKALILAKIIRMGDLIGLGRRLENKPLIIPTLYKTAVFTLWTVLFRFIEVLITGLIKGNAGGSLVDFLTKQRYELAANVLVVFIAFIPFFAFRELERVLGEKKIRDLYFRRGQTSASEVSKELRQ